MTRHFNSALPISSWPLDDRGAWSAAFDLDIFAENAASTLSAATVYGRKQSYGAWLGYVDAFDPDAMGLPWQDRLTPDRVRTFCETLSENCRDTTIYHILGRLYYVARAMSPERDWKWLYRASRRMAADAVPIRHPHVTSDQLYALGFRLMDKAEAKAARAAFVSKSAAMMYRDGLLIATLVETAMRRGAFSKLQISEHMERNGRQWGINVPAKITKTDLDQEYVLSPDLSGRMSTYLERYRVAFPGAAQHDWLWVHINCAMTDKMIRRRTISWTHGVLGVPVSPHRFRAAAANFILQEDPENFRMAKDLLGHASFVMTEKHYLGAAQSRAAGCRLTAVMARMRLKALSIS